MFVDMLIMDESTGATKRATTVMMDGLVDNDHLRWIATNADPQNQRIEFDRR